MKNTLRILLALCLALTVLGTCAALAEETPLTQGIYEKRFTAEGRGEYVAYFHFYENGVYYYSLYNGGQYGAGYWTLEDGEVEYFANDDDFTEPTMSDKMLVLTKLDGSEYATLGYDTEKDLVVNLPSYYNFNFTHIADSDHTDADEVGINVIEYVLPDDDFCMVALKHNGIFEDSIDEIIEGTWTREGDTFILTDEDSGESYTVTVKPDGTADYVGLNGETIKLISTAAPAKNAVISFDGLLEGAAYGDMVGHVDCYDDGTLKMTISYATVDRVIEGEWALAEDYSKITFNFDGVEVIAPFDYEKQTFSFEYPCSDGTQDVVLPFVRSAAEPTAVYTFVGENIKEISCTLLSDGTCTLDFAGLGTVTSGTWSIDTTSGPLPQFTIELDNTFEDAGVTVETDYATKFFFAYKNASGTLSETLALSFADYQAATAQ